MSTGSDGGNRVLAAITALDLGGAERRLCQILLPLADDGFGTAVVSPAPKGVLADILEQSGIPVCAPDGAMGRSGTRTSRKPRRMLHRGHAWTIGSESLVAMGDAFSMRMTLLPHIEEILRPVSEPVEMISVVTGKFIRVDFEARKLEILHPETNKMVDCLYQDNVEPLLLNNPRELIQVVGTVELNADGAPVRITDVQDILEVDLSLIALRQVPLEQGQLTAYQPMALSPTLSEVKQFYEIEHEELGISLIAFTRDELIDAPNEEVASTTGMTTCCAPVVRAGHQTTGRCSLSARIRVGDRRQWGTWRRNSASPSVCVSLAHGPMSLQSSPPSTLASWRHTKRDSRTLFWRPWQRRCRCSSRTSAAIPRRCWTARRAWSCHATIRQRLAAALKRLIENHELRRRYGEAGRRRVVEHFSLARCVGEYERLYEALLRKH